MGTLRSRGQNEQKWRETNAEGGSTKYQTIVFQKQNGVGTQEFDSRYPPPYAHPPLSFPSLCSRALTSFPTHGGPRHSQNSWVKYKLHQTHTHTCIHTQAHTRCFHRLWAWERFVDSAQLVPGTKLAGDSPPCALRGTTFLCGCTGNVWVTWHWEYSSSFHCNQMGLDTQYRTVKK